MSHGWLKFAFDAYWLITGVYAWRAGGREEKIGVAITSLGCGVTAVAMPITHNLAGHGSFGLWVVDVLTFVAYWLLAQRCHSFWPLWAAGLQLAALGMAAAVPTLPRSAMPAYMLAQGVWGYMILLALVLGARRHNQRNRSSSYGASNRPPRT